MLLYGDAFWPTYTTGDNTGLIATDSMKNFIQRETMNFQASDLEGFCHFLATKFLATYPQVEGIQVSAEEIPYTGLGGPAFTPSGPDRATARDRAPAADASSKHAPASAASGCFVWAAARSTASFATSTRRCRI